MGMDHPMKFSDTWPISKMLNLKYITNLYLKYSTYCDGDVISAIHHGSQKSIVEV